MESKPRLTDQPLVIERPEGDRDPAVLSDASLTAEIIRLRQELAEVRHHNNTLTALLNDTTAELNAVKTQLKTQLKTSAIASMPLEQLQGLIEAMPVAVMITRMADSAILYANQTVSLISGMSQEELLTHKSLDFYYDPADQQVLFNRLEQDEAVQDYELRYRKSDGTLGWLTVSMRKLIFDNQLAILSTFYDITERKQTAGDLAEKDAFLQLVLDNIPQLIFWKDCDSRFLGCNQRWADITGLGNSQSIIGKTDYDLYAQDADNPVLAKEIAYYIAQDQRIIATGQPELNLLEHKTKSDGREFWFSTNKLPIHNAMGQVVGILGTIEDVTERKRAEWEVQHARDQLQTILDAVPGPISWIGADGRYLGVNENLASKYDLPPEAFIGQPMGFLEGGSAFSEFMTQFLAQPESAATQVVEMTVRGTKKYYLIAAQKCQQGHAAVSIGIDMTDRKQTEEALRLAEENYRSIFENALDGIFQSSPDGHYLNVNAALAKIYGYGSPAEMMASITNIGQQIYVDAEKRTEFIDRLVEQGMVKDFEYRCYCKDQRIIWVQVDARAVKDNMGTVLYYEGFVQDITKRKQREDELRRQLEALKIEIDHKKRQKEVAMVTESSYFQEIQHAIAEIDLDEFWS